MHAHSNHGTKATARDKARQNLQATATSLRRMGAEAGESALVNAAAEVEAIFDRLYFPDDPAPTTERSPAYEAEEEVDE